MTKAIDHDIYQDTLKQLLIEVSELRKKIAAHAKSRLDKYHAHYPGGVLTKVPSIWPITWR